MVETSIEKIAEFAHEANRIYCESLGDNSQVNWDNAPEWQKESAINGVKFHLNNPNSKPEDSHNSWMEEKIKNGWIYGKIKNVETKEHPCLVHYESLPIDQKIKDILFLTIVKTFSRIN